MYKIFGQLAYFYALDTFIEIIRAVMRLAAEASTVVAHAYAWQAIMNTFIHQNGRVTDRERQYKQQTYTCVMQSLLKVKT